MGSNSWRHATNHNAMIAHQNGFPADGVVTLAYYGGSAFQITSPSGLTLMIDPWRNHPAGTADWFYHDFPHTQVDIGVSTHAHFDHDALHLLDASTVLDRLIGTFEFGDVRLTGIADKHAIDDECAPYDMHRLAAYFGGATMVPPDNARSWDNCLILIETGGMRILHWGDNRHNPPDNVWDRFGKVDVLILPIDDSEHVLSYAYVETIVQRLNPRLVIPCHYYTWNVTQRQSTLLPSENWLQSQPHILVADNGTVPLVNLPDQTTAVDWRHMVAFDVDAWHASHGVVVSDVSA
jgi:L-ascorbate metabolism protein UlaG (beta-lactamase superfamily)